MGNCKESSYVLCNVTFNPVSTVSDCNIITQILANVLEIKRLGTTIAKTFDYDLRGYQLWQK
jgi:hypothetical protein